VIAGVKTKNLICHPDERGRLWEILRSDDEIFQQFGQVYVTTAYPGVVKAWHAHRHQTDFFTVISGKARFVLYDMREGSKTRGELAEFFLSRDDLRLVTIPPGVYHGFKCVGDEEVIALNCPTRPYSAADPDELRLPPDSDQIPYHWALSNQ
jgi:dTDP-4-dehydrorhamnose 3,5-epimerase